MTGTVSVDLLGPSASDSLEALRDRYRSTWLNQSSRGTWGEFEAEAFTQLRELMVGQAQLAPMSPRCSVQRDQIVWARSPVRLDIAGGWTDTPPYCLEHGGRVVNLAADLNGQPPIQVFARISDRPEIVLRSIDLGLHERVTSYEELDTFGRFDSPFALAKAALALAGFLPRFHCPSQFGSLKRQLRDFGGGIEVSLLPAVPKGSGLGASSILAVTTMAALSALSGLGWTREVLFRRTLALEQMLTTGGGWQDQAGALYRGLKLVETKPGLVQHPELRWLPGDLFGPGFANELVLLYYTGLTRLAKGILIEIVRRVLLNSTADLETIRAIGDNALLTSEAIQRCDYGMLLEAVRNSWDLNQRLDSGTNPPQVKQLLAGIEDYLGATKLLGAGGGGFLLLFAKDEQAAARIKRDLAARPPNRLARFVDFTLSSLGTQTTKS
jgi:galactokinase/mevalonate kinase-like predicted kinase